MVEAKKKNQKKTASATPEGKRAATEAEKKEAMQKAIAVIEEGLRKGRGGQESGHRWMPLNWHTEFKPLLGPYKKFVLSCDSFRVENGENPERYTVHIRDKEAPQSNGSIMQQAGTNSRDWKIELEKAWRSYCLTTPKAEQRSADFVESARRISESADDELLKKRKGDSASSATHPAKKTKKKKIA